MTSPADRLEIVRPAVPIDLAGAVLGESWSNDVWLTDQSVLRVCWRGDRERLLREQALLDSLPPSVPHADVLASGKTRDLTWMVLRRLPGERLDLLWPRLSDRQRVDAGACLAGALKALHEWRPPPQVRELLQPTPPGPSSLPDEIVGTAIMPLPLSRLLPLVAWLEKHPVMDQGLAGRVRERIEELGPLISEVEFADGVVVHGDAHLANVLWGNGSLTTLLDLEWTRIGPRDLELEAILRDDPDIQARKSASPLPASEVRMLTGLRSGYPELFTQEHLTERLWFYDICFQIRQLCVYKTLDARSLDGLAGLTDCPRVRLRLYRYCAGLWGRVRRGWSR